MPDRFVTAYFRKIEAVLAAKSNAIHSTHKGDRGDSREDILLEVLNDHLPLIVRAHKGGAIIDVKDQLSSQIDIIVYSNWAPLLKQSGKPLFLSSGCHAAIEVKSTLTSDVVREFFATSRRLKSMRKFLFPIDEIEIFPKSRTANSLCTGLFAFQSSVTPKKVLELIQSFEKEKFPSVAMPDFICINSEGCWQRWRTEDDNVFAWDPRTPESTPEDLRRQAAYSFMDYNTLPIMLETILDYCSYIGPLRESLSMYVHDWSRGTDDIE